MCVISLLSSPHVQHLLLFFLFVGPFNCLASYSHATELLYSLNEGLPAGVLIGSLAEDLRLVPGAGRQDTQSQPPEHSGAERNPPLSFSLASQGLSGQYVTLDAPVFWCVAPGGWFVCGFYFYVIFCWLFFCGTIWSVFEIGRASCRERVSSPV